MVTSIYFELISPERILFAGEVRAVMLPASAGDMTVMPGHEPLMTTLDPGIVMATDTLGHGFRAFVRRGYAEITGMRVTVLAERSVPPEELTRESIDEEIARMEAVRDTAQTDSARRDADFAVGRLERVRATLDF